MAEQYGLEWKDSLWGAEPRWTADPGREHIEQIARQSLQLQENTTCAVDFYSQGAFNKLFTVASGAKEWLMRVALPVDPYRKTASEVATMCFVREWTTIPVPHVYAHCPTSHNQLRFEWILMERMPGSGLQRAWRTMPWSKKADLVRRLAQSQADLFCKSAQFDTIGNLFKTHSGSYEIGSIVSMFFFWGDRGAHNINRGPFQNSHQWLLARLKLTLEDQDKILASSDDEDDIEDAKQAKSLTERLIALLPQIFHPNEVESTMLFHDDLHGNNILVDEVGTLTAILDWECVSILPLWMACQPPALLNGATRSDEPRRENYSAYDPEVDDDDLEYNQGLSTLYWTELLAYERGELRHLFLQEMENLDSAWFEQYQNGHLKRDFELAVQHCDSELTMKRVKSWLDAYDSGQSYSLRESLDP